MMMRGHPVLRVAVLMMVVVAAALVSAQNASVNVTTTTAPMAPLTSIDETFIADGIASPSRSASFYALAASDRYSPSSLPGTLYLFRQTASLTGTEVQNQRPIITRFSGDIRQVSIVVVPTGAITDELITDTQILSSGYQVVVLGDTYCNCPLTPVNFTYASTDDSNRYPTREAFFSNGTLTSILDFGYLTNHTLVGRVYKQLDVNGKTLGYMIDSVPGDASYSPMRQLFTVTVAAAVTTVAALSALVQSDSGLYFNMPVTNVLGADSAAELFQLATGYHRGNVVRYYHFNASRLTTTVARSTGLAYAKMYVLQTTVQTVPIVDTVPGNTDYSDLWHVIHVTVDASTPNVTWPIRQASDIPSAWPQSVTGSYINCPVVNANSTLENPLDAVKVPVFYRGDTRYCFNFSYAPGCALKPAYSLRRSGDLSYVAGNDLFTSGPNTDVGYGPFAYLMPYGVPQQYQTGTIQSAGALVAPASIASDPAGSLFANRPIVYEATAMRAQTSYTNRMTVSSRDQLAEATVLWSVNGTAIDVQVSCTRCHGYVAIGFGGSMSHQGIFVAGFIDASGISCVRQLEGSTESRLGLSDHSANALNITATSLSIEGSGAERTTRFQFTRSITVTESGYTQYSLGTAIAERMTVITRRSRLTSCATALATQLSHDFVSAIADHVWVANGSSTAVFTAEPTTAPVAPTPIPLANIPLASDLAVNESWSGQGTYRCDGEMTVTWQIDFNTSTPTISFVIAMPANYVGWAAIGFGQQMAGADIISVHRNPQGDVAVVDRKGILQALPPVDAFQSVELVSWEATDTATTFIIRRSLNTGDASTSAQPRSRTTLVSRSLSHVRGWANGVLVAYYDIGNGPSFGTVNATATATMYVFVSSIDVNGTSTSLLHSFQDALVDTVPGQPGYSDLWDVEYVEVPSTFAGPVLRAVHEIPVNWTRVPDFGDARINCVVVHMGTSIDLQLPSRTLWYRGSVQKCIEFPTDTYANSITTTQRMLHLISNATNLTTDVIFDTSPTDAGYSSFVMRYHAIVPAGYIIGSWTDIDTFISTSGYPVVATGVHANVPVVNLNNVTATFVPGPSQTAAVDILTPELLAEYEHRQTLAVSEAGSPALDFYWRYDFDNLLLYSMVVGYNINGYVAIGFSNASYSQMEESDIVMGYIDALTATPCIRVMYSQFTVGAPSSPTTMFIRNPSVQRSGGATILRFERTFSANAHGAGVIPTPAQGATSRIIYAVQPANVALNCTSTTFNGLYHGTNPHGSRLVNWLGVTAAPPGVSTPAPTTSSGTQVLTRVDLTRRTLFYRGFSVPAYCAPNFNTGFDGATVSTPTLYFPVLDDGVTPAQSPIATSSIGFGSYTGMWKVVFAVVPANWTTATSEAELLYANVRAERTFTNATAVRNCPIVHAGSTVEVQDRAAYPKIPIYFNGQLLSCFDWGTFAAMPAAVDRSWNGSAQLAPVIDSLSVPLKWEWTISSTTPFTDASRIAAQPTTSTTNLHNCIVVQSGLALALRGARSDPSSTAFELRSGYFNGRRASYFRVQSAVRFASEFEVRTNPMYVIKNGTTAFAGDLQGNYVVGVGNGNGTYSDIWRIVIVDASSLNVAITNLQSEAALAALPQYTTGLYFNCPVVAGTSTFGTGDTAVIQRSLFVDGVEISCAQFGYIGAPPAQIPRVHDLFTSSGSAVADGTLFATAPGAASYFPVQWVVKTTLTSSVPAGLTSVAALNTTLSTSRDSYVVWNIFIVSIATGIRDTTLRNVVSLDGELQRLPTDYAALLTAPVITNLTLAASAPPAPAASLVYVFRRGLFIDSVEVAYQQPIIAAAPGEVQYTSAGGSAGYSDVHDVVVVSVPDNASTTVLTNVAELRVRIQAGTFQTNTSTGLQKTLFVAVNESAAASVSCPRITVWSEDRAVPALDCGVNPSATTAEVDVNGTVGSSTNPLRSRDDIGLSMFAAIPLTATNGNLIQDFGATQRPAFAQTFPAKVHELQAATSGATLESMPRGAKYVFRQGPSLHGSVETPLPALIEPERFENGSPVFANLFEVKVVNVAAGSSTFSVSDLPSTIASVADMYALVASRCWAIETTGVVEVGRVLLFQNTLDNVAGLTTETVMSRGSQYKWVIASTSTPAITVDAANYAIAVYANGSTTVNHYLLPFTTMAEARTSALRRILQITVQDPSAYRSVSDTDLADATELGVAVLHVSAVSLKPFVEAPTQQSYQRGTGYFAERGVKFYNMGSATSIAAATSPSPMYFLRIVNSRGGVVSITGAPIITMLPGHEGYSDLHRIHYCSIPEAADGSTPDVTPTSESDILSGLARGTISSCVADVVHNMPIVHAESTIESQDMYDGVLNPSGVRLVTVRFNGDLFRAFDFGAVTIDFDPTRDIAAVMRRNSSGALLENPVVFDTAEPVGTATMTTSPLKRGIETFVEDAYVSGTVSLFSALSTVALSMIESVNVYNVPIVSMDTVLPAILYDDAVIAAGPMSMLWAHGALSSTIPYEYAKHTGNGIARVDFFTGSTDQQTNPPVDSLGHRSVQFGTSFSMSWELRAPSSRRRAAATFAPGETEIVITLETRRDQWIAIGLSSTGGMVGSIIYLFYVSATQISVGGVPTVHASERYASGYTEPAIEPEPLMRLESFRLNGNGTGYRVTFSRPLVPPSGNATKGVIVDGSMAVIWAQGNWDQSTNSPRQHSVRGQTSINWIQGDYVEVPERTLSYWYIAVLIVVIFFVFISAFLLRTIEPGLILFCRPLSKCSSSATSVFGSMVVAHWVLLFLMFGVLVCWYIGNALDMRDSRISDPWWRAFGCTAQLLTCFVFLPMARTNPVLWALGTTFHKARRWFLIMLYFLVLLCWIHGVAMLFTGPRDTSSLKWWGGVVALVALSIYMITAGGIAPVSSRARYYANWLLWLVFIVFVCIHMPMTAVGLIPTFLVLLCDWFLRLKDRQSRWGVVRSYATPSKRTVAIELATHSPWHGCCVRPFAGRAGSFVYCLMEGWPHPVPLVISSRITQEEGESEAIFTSHVRGTVQDTIQAVNAPRRAADGDANDNNDRVAEGCSNFEQFLLRCAGTRNLGNRVVYLEGAYGGCRLNLKWYRTLILVCGGVGLGPSLALLDALTRDPDYFRRSSIQAVKLMWVVREPSDLLTFADDLHGILNGALPINLQLFVFVTQSNNPIVDEFNAVAPATANGTGTTPQRGGSGSRGRQYEDDENDDDEELSQQPYGDDEGYGDDDDEHDGGDDHLPSRFSPAQDRGHQTPTPKKKKKKAKRLGDIRDRQTRELALVLPKHPLFDSIQVFYGRPVFTQFFAEQKTNAMRKGESAVGVHVCAPPEMAARVVGTADAVSDWGALQFHVDVERFDTMDLE